jgi:hypothetical protein
LLNQALAQEKDVNARWKLAEGLAAVAGRLEPAEAARLLGQALAQEQDVYVRRHLVEGLAAVAGRLEAAEAARVLNQALAQEKGGYGRHQFAAGLAVLAGRLEPTEAARVCVEAARSCISALDEGSDEAARRDATEGVSRLIQSLDNEGTSQAARVFARWIVSDPDLFYYEDRISGSVGFRVFHPEVLERFLTSASRPQVRRRAAAIAAAVGTSTNGPALSLPLLPAADEPLPCRLTTQDLVELLKMPTCVREVRRVILNQLGNRYGRRFDTHWDFVRYAQQHGLDLDFTTPPKRPDRKLPPLFEP